MSRYFKAPLRKWMITALRVLTYNPRSADSIVKGSLHARVGQCHHAIQNEPDP